ncbi:MAG: PhoX family phosphatase [Hyphomonadaceae bacterium]|nr:PhoX family phosphatase [Hyphomonadaceae bacterium]
MSSQSQIETPTLSEVTARRWSRRGILAGAGALALAAPACATRGAPAQSGYLPAPAAALSFAPVVSTTADTVTLPAGYTADVLIGWGDPLFETVRSDFDLHTMSRAEQERRFGANNDMLALFPARFDAEPTGRWLLCANHEYADPFLMYADLKGRGWSGMDGERWAAAYAAVGISVVEVEQGAAGWSVVMGAGNRRITAFSPVAFTGPAAGHPWIVRAGAFVNAHESGIDNSLIRCGTLANCAGGQTPWGTFLSVEENFNYSFFVSDAEAPELRAARADQALVLDAASFAWPLFDGLPRPGAPPQFDTTYNPTIASLYGWTVEIDPYDPHSIPKKRTALGRRTGENATVALTRDQRVAVYSGDDQANEFVYKFISRGRFQADAPRANMDLLDEGELYAARFEEDGSGRWIKLDRSAANRAAAAAGALHRFSDDGDLMVRARLAARLLGATPMDRPEDIEVLKGEGWVGLGPVLVVCTKNPEHGAERPGNPRRGEGLDHAQANLAGHILRLDEADGDLGAMRFTWDVFVLAGDPVASEDASRTRSGAPLHASVAWRGYSTANGDRFACPDNLALDGAGNLFITTDGSDDVFADCNDSVLACPIEQAGPKPIKRFLVGPVGCEICGPVMTPSRDALLLAIQHPGESDRSGKRYSDAVLEGSAERPASAWPDGAGAWPRASVIVVRREDGGSIGS